MAHEVTELGMQGAKVLDESAGVDLSSALTAKADEDLLEEPRFFLMHTISTMQTL